jgi:hypothetical protein
MDARWKGSEPCSRRGTASSKAGRPGPLATPPRPGSPPLHRLHVAVAHLSLDGQRVKGEYRRRRGTPILARRSDFPHGRPPLHLAYSQSYGNQATPPWAVDSCLRGLTLWVRRRRPRRRGACLSGHLPGCHLFLLRTRDARTSRAGWQQVRVPATAIRPPRETGGRPAGSRLILDVQSHRLSSWAWRP